MKYKNLNQKKGVAGLTILLTVVAMLFMIGLIVMVFVVAGSRLQTSVITTDTTSVTQNGINLSSSPVTLTACNNARDGGSVAVTTIVNASNGASVSADNYTTSGCTISNTTAVYNLDLLNATYTYSFTSNPEAQDTINETKTSIGGVTDWFDIFIVLTALVVLVLLVVIIINSIRGSGLMGNNGGSKEFA